MKVNNKKQSDAVRQKYTELLKALLGKGFEGKDWNYSIHYSDKK